MCSEGFLSNEEISRALGRGSGMFHIPDILRKDGGLFRKGFYVDPENSDEGVVVVLRDDSAILVHPDEFVVEGGRAKWTGEGSQGDSLEVIGRATNIRLV